jgi:hypothetical protein
MFEKTPNCYTKFGGHLLYENPYEVNRAFQLSIFDKAKRDLAKWQPMGRFGLSDAPSLTLS